jgi:NAD(P)-dependent dehydrogenase (short-subunit alcohol dehydrogenase family)
MVAKKAGRVRVVITGESKLAEQIALNAEDGFLFDHVRVEDDIEWDDFDIFVNCAHVGFEQTNLLMDAYKAWKDDSSKKIINISSRAAQPNISKGYLYSAQKAALNHLANNLVYNSDKACRITTMNLGLLEDQLPSISYKQVAEWVNTIMKGGPIEVTDITLSHPTNYIDVQKQKDVRRRMIWEEDMAEKVDKIADGHMKVRYKEGRFKVK